MRLCEFVQPYPRQAVGSMVASAMEAVDVETSHQGTKKTSLEDLCYLKMFRGSRVEKCFVRKELQLTGKKS